MWLQVEEANEITQIKQNMIEALRDQADHVSLSRQQASSPVSRESETLEAYSPEVEGGYHYDEGDSHEAYSGETAETLALTMMEDMAAKQAKEMAQMQKKMQEDMQEQMQRMQQQMNEQMGVSTPPRAKVLVSRAHSDSSLSAATESDGEIDLDTREEDFRVTISRLLESSQTLETCLNNLKAGLAKVRMPKVVMEVKVAANAKEIMNISLQDLFGSHNHMPEYVMYLKHALADRSAKFKPKPTGLVWKRLESRYNKHMHLLRDATQTALALNHSLAINL